SESGEPGSETWKDKHNAWRIGGGGVWQTASYDPATNLVFYGTGDAFPSFDPEFRPGDNLFTASTIALDADTGKIVWYFQETPNEHWDFDTPSPKMLYEVNLNGETRKVVANFSRNGYYHTPHPRQRPVPARRPVPGEDHRDERDRPEDRQAGRLRSQQGCAELCGHRRAARQARRGGLPVVERLAHVLPADARRQARHRL